MENTISILGCGWYGLPLAKELLSQHYLVKGSTTTPDKLEELQRDGIRPYLVSFNEGDFSYDPDFFYSETLVICIPPKRASGGQFSFPGKIKSITEAAKKGLVKNILFISSTSVYGDRNQIETESSATDADTPSGLAMIEAENILRSEPRFNVGIIRFAGLVGPGRDPARFFAGKTNVPNGQAPVNLIHLKDCIGITTAILEQQAFGLILNAVCPDHPEKQEFYTKAAQRSGLEIPAFINELKNWKQVSTNHIPERLNYSYQISDWMHWLGDNKL